MPRVKIPIIAPPYPTIDGIELDQNSISIIDGYIDEAKYLVKRPGLLSTYTLPESSPVDGVSFWQSLDLVIAVSNQSVYSIDSAGVITNLSTLNGAYLQFRNRPSFAYTVVGTTEYMAVANGGSIFISTDGGSLVEVSDAQAPTDSTHLAFVNNRLVSNQIGSDTFRWSNFEDPFTWDVLSFATAEGEPDQITALYKAYNEVVLFGSNTIEFWYATGEADSPFRRMQGTQLNQGTLSPDGVVFDGEDSTFYFIDSERNINALLNRSTKNISAPIEASIQKLSTVLDARLDIIKFDSHKFLICSFPTDEVTYVYDIPTGYWCQWGKYDDAIADYRAFLGRSVAWSNIRGLNFIGSTESDGVIYALDRSTYTDGGDSIRTATTTGWIDAGTHQSKRWKRLLARGKKQSNTGFTYQIIARKDYEGTYQNERTIDLSNSANSSFVHRVLNFGSARAIQFTIYHTEDSPFILGNFELEYTQHRI
jgi:hypothetical protein